jgi:hypothetical protein
MDIGPYEETITILPQRIEDPEPVTIPEREVERETTPDRELVPA